MTKTINGGHSTIQLYDNRQGLVGPNEKGIIIATAENRVSEWLRESLLYNMGRRHRLRYASRMNELNSDVGQVAAMVKISTATVRRWVLEGYIPYMKIGKAIRFSNSDIRLVRQLG